MPRSQTFEFLQSQGAGQPLLGFFVNLVLSALLAFVLGRLYVRCGRSLSNRESLAGNFVLLTVTTMLVISVVKSSLALSLGLVGALSIVRFRAAIKEPEELVYLFLAIALGLGFGADQWRITILAFLFVALIIIAKARLAKPEQRQNLFLTVSSGESGKFGLDEVVGVLAKHCSAVNVTRFDESRDALEASFLVDVESFEQLDAMKRALRELNESMSVTFLESRGLA